MGTILEQIKLYEERTPKSRLEYEKARELTPGGVGSAIQFYNPHPIYVDHSKGSRVWDLDGNEYIDYTLCFGAMTELQRRFPFVDKLRFTNSGVEATTYAIRVARAATRKDKFIKVEGGYHGGMDELFISNHPPKMEMAGPDWDPTPVVQSAGTRSDAAEHAVIVPFNDIEAMERKLAQYKDEIACVILVPVMTNGGVILPKDGYLQGVRELTKKYNVVLIFDEIKTGCRIAPGGASERYGVQPDLITLAKIIGGGTSLGMFGGRKDLMDLVDPIGHVAHGGTYCANPLTMAAGIACLKEVMTDETYKEMYHLADLFGEGLRSLIRKYKLPACVPQIGTLGGLMFMPDQPTNYRDTVKCDKEMWSHYWFSMLNLGIIPMGCAWFQEWSISAMHSEDDIERTLKANDEAFAEIAKTNR